MTDYLLDTNILSDLIHRPQGVIARKIASVGEDRVATSILVACELRFGAAKKGAGPLADRVSLVLSLIKIHPFQTPADENYGRIRATLEKSGRIIGANDQLIAAQCVSMDAILVTDNVGEFSRVEGLRIENWLR